MVVFEIGDGVGHVRLTAQECFPPEDIAVADDPAFTGHMLGQGPGSKLRTDRARPELRMCKVKVVLPLHDVIGEFVAERIPDPPGLTV